MGGFTPHYPPPPSTFSQPPLPADRNDGMSLPPMYNSQPLQLPTHPDNLPYRQPPNPKMKPHLQLMVGPLLRYDTIENGIWRGAVLIVGECTCSRIRSVLLSLDYVILTYFLREASDAGSYYDPQPTLRFYYDHSLPPPGPSTHTRRAPPSNSHHGSDTAPSSPIPDAYGKTSEIGLRAQAMAVTGQEIWVYRGHSGWVMGPQFSYFKVKS